MIRCGGERLLRSACVCGIVARRERPVGQLQEANRYDDVVLPRNPPVLERNLAELCCNRSEIEGVEEDA